MNRLETTINTLKQLANKIYQEDYEIFRILESEDNRYTIALSKAISELSAIREYYESPYKFEIHQREWNSGNIVTIIFASNSLEECIEFADKWNDTTDKLYEGKCVDDRYCYFASVYNNEIDEYI
jgi:hypothetical protein